MRCAMLLASSIYALSAMAQTITTVQDGDWDDPATWDCNCIPYLEDVEILHTVQFTENMKLIMQHIHVADGAAIIMDGPHLVVMLEEVVNDGLMLLAGNVDTDGELYNNGVIDVDGAFLTHGQLVMGGWGTMLSAVNMEMGGTVSGQGYICIGEASVCYGIIQGEVDVCDLSPTTSTPPFLDFFTGTVAPTVTYCLGGACHVAVPDVNALENVQAWPVPADAQLTLDGLPVGLACTVEMRDAVGRMMPVRLVRYGSRMTVDAASLPAGVYALVLSTASETRTVRVVVDR
jgi:hypothetical protein